MHWSTLLKFIVLIPLFSSACGGSGQPSSPDSGTTELSSNATFEAQAQPPISGAIFTTNANGEVVNGNIYDSKLDVYLNGGPNKAGVAALPDGDFYYQITDPGCKELLAGPNPSGGGIPNTAAKLITVVNGETDPVLTQLAPFNDTPNNGGEYKVWVTPVDQYDPTAKNSCFGFVSKYSKTDNYKVRPPGTQCISGTKFYDVNHNGILESEDTQTIAGFKIILTFPDASTDFTYTGTSGDYAFCGLDDGTYGVAEQLPPYVGGVLWIQTYPASLIYSAVVDGADVTGLDFANSCSLCGKCSNTPCTVPVY